MDLANVENEPADDKPVDAELVDSAMAGRQAYNMITDTVTGVNVRVSDNVFQAIAILVCLILGAAIGAAAFAERILAAVVGGFIGLLVGLFGSGIWLMCYRAVCHLRGRHD